MEIVSYRFFSGPNRHTLSAAMEAILDLKGYGREPSTARPRFVEALNQGLPGLFDHFCSRGVPGGFGQRLKEGTYLGHVVEHVALELLFLGGEDGTYGKTRELDGTRVRIVFECLTEKGGILALTTATRLVTNLWDGQDVSWSDLIPRFIHELKKWHLGPSTKAIVDEAKKRGIPVLRLNDANYVRLGQGKHQRRIMAATTDQTSILGIDLAQDKPSAKIMLENAGIPVPKGLLCHSVQEAVTAAHLLGFPVVVKPQAGRQGMGVSMHLGAPAEVEKAFLYAESVSEGPILVEEEISGTAYRLLVVGDKMVAATRRIPPFVVGDGHSSIKELVNRLNQDPRRGPGHAYPMTWVELDATALLHLRQQGFEPGEVPEDGKHVFIRATANMSTGASACDVTALIHPDLALDAVRAAQALGLDVAGVDIVTTQLDRSLDQACGAVIEVNASPGLRMHLYPSEGVPQPVAQKIVDYLFGSSQGRIPVAAITGTNGKTTVTRMLAHIWSETGALVGMSTTDGVSIGQSIIKHGDLTGPWSARLVLNDPGVEVAVLETARGGMARAGLGFDDCDVAVVTNIGADHLGQDDIWTLDDLVHLKSLVVDAVRPEGASVLNADDANVLKMAERSRGRVVLFSCQEQNPVVRRLLENGGEAVYLKRGSLYYGHHQKEVRLIGSRVLPVSLGGIADINIANAAAAAAAAIAMGLAPAVVRRALATFPAGGVGMNRGRLEMLQGPDVRVLLDYGHNAPAIQALGDICRRLKTKEIITVLGLPGDRRNEDIAEAAKAAAAFSRRIVIREDADRRNRQPGEVAELIRLSLMAAGMAEEALEVVLDEGAAVRRSILSAPPSALILILFEQYVMVRKEAESSLEQRGRKMSPISLVSQA